LEAPLNVEHLEKALASLVKKHPVLRASFNVSDYSAPLLLVHKHVATPVRFEDISSYSKTEQEQIYEQWFVGERRNHFDFVVPPLFRIHIFKCGPRSFYFSLTEHHAILDGWSVASFVTELFHQYMAYERGESSLSNPLPGSSYQEFISLEKGAMASGESAAYWREHLRDFVSSARPFTESTD